MSPGIPVGSYHPTSNHRQRLERTTAVDSLRSSTCSQFRDAKRGITEKSDATSNSAMTVYEPNGRTAVEPPLAPDSGETSRVLLLIDHEENRRLLANWLSSEHEVVHADPAEALDETIDLCIIGQSSLQRHADVLRDKNDAVGPVFLPYLLVVSQRNSEQLDSDIWKRVNALVGDCIDELITTPIQKAELKGRIGSLLRARQQSLQLNDQTEELETLHHINTVIRKITRALVQASTRDEIEQTVCDRLVEAEPYQLAWIGEPNSDAEEIEPLASAGADNGYLEDVTVTFEENETESGSTETAVRTREMQVSQNLSKASVSGWRRQRRAEAGLRSVASIPLVYDETLYGVLNVYADHADAFDSNERDLLAELGSTIPYAMHTVMAKERYRSFVEDIFGTSEVAVRILDSTDTIAWTNEAFEQYFGVDRSDVVGRDNAQFVQNDFTQRIADPEPFAEMVTAPYDETTDVETFECHVPPADDRDERYLHHRSQPIESGHYAGGRIELYYNITQRKRVESELEETIGKLERSNERLEQFAYAASHDLQEPLRMVSSYLQMIDRRYSDELDEDGREFIEFAVDGADRMRDMIEGLLEYSRVDTRANSFEPVDLNDVLADVRDDLQMSIEETNADIAVESLPRVEGDEGQLRQVFQNLLDNAIEYSGDEPPQVHVSAERDGNEWMISVSDEGIGIKSDDADRVFEVFQSLHTNDEHAGTGIGLALCERIVERHGGDIWVESKPGEGSTFSFTLPPDSEHSK